MDYNDIEQLLERYWQCETSTDEEARLRAFFTGNEVPKHLLPYKPLFDYQNLLHDAELGDEFDARVLAEVETLVVKARRLTLTARFVPLMKAAAVLAVILALGNVVQHSMFSDVREAAATDTIGNRISAPSVALSGAKEQTEIHEQQLLDSLRRVEKEMK